MKTLLEFHRMFKRALLLAMLSFAVAAPLSAQDRYLPLSKPDAVALLPAPPAADSAEQAADLAEVQSAAKNRTPEDAARGKSESDLSLATFASTVGPAFNPDKLPKTTALFREVLSETKAATDAGKKYWKRPRPYEVDPKLLEGEKESSFGYPSGHSTRATVYSLLLAELFPEKRAAILAEGRQIGWDRVMLGRHYETDIFAGRVLGQAIVQQLHENSAFERDFAAAKAEVEAAKAETNGVKPQTAASTSAN
jgi:acid phosphatase (class A)